MIWALVAAVILLGAWYFFFYAPDNNIGPASAQATPGTTETGASGTQSGVRTTSTLRTLATQGGNYTCEIEAREGAEKVTGTIYASGSKTRLDFRAETPGGVAESHIIRDGTWAYMWVEGMTVGTRTRISGSSSVVPQPHGFIISDDSSLTSECRPWVPKAGEFVPPVQITFSTV